MKPVGHSSQKMFPVLFLSTLSQFPLGDGLMLRRPGDPHREGHLRGDPISPGRTRVDYRSMSRVALHMPYYVEYEFGAPCTAHVVPWDQ